MEERRYGEVTTYDTRSESNGKVDRQKRYAQIKGILTGKQMTAKEVAVEMHRLGYTDNDDRNNAAPRLTELAQNGTVEPIGRKKCAWTGKMVAVYAMR